VFSHSARPSSVGARRLPVFGSDVEDAIDDEEVDDCLGRSRVGAEDGLFCLGFEFDLPPATGRIDQLLLSGEAISSSLILC